MDFSQILIPIIVIAPLIVLVAFAVKRRPAKRAPLPTLQPSPVHLLPRQELSASRSTTVTRELTLPAKYERALAQLLKGGGDKSAASQLPPLPPFFVGRRGELARAFTLLDAPNPARALAITSSREVAGVGRATFATTLAHLLTERFPDAQLFLDLRGDSDAPLSVVDAMRHFIRSVNPKAALPHDLAELPALYHASLENRRVLLVAANISPQPFLELLQPPAGSLLLLSSREPVAFARIETIVVEPLSRPDARAFLRASGARITRELDKNLDLLAELSGYLPEALQLNGARLQANPTESIETHIDQLKKANAFKEPLEAARALSGVTAPEPETVAAMLIAPPTEPEQLKTETPAAEKTPEAWKEARAFVQRFQTRSESDFLLSDLPAPFAEISRGPAPTYADSLRFLAEFPNTFSEGASETAWLEAAVSATRALGDRSAEIAALSRLGRARMKTGEPRLAVACFERWVELARAAGDRLSEAEGLGWLGAGWSGSGLASRATGCFEAQLRLAREAGDRATEVRALGKLGQAKSTLGEFQEAATHHGEQLRVAMEIQDRAAELDALENLGLAWTRLKEIEKAAGYHEEQLLTARATGDLSAESRALGHLGQVAVHRGKIEDAIEKYDAQLEVALRIDDLPAQSHAHANLGVAWARQGDLRKAVTHYQQQLAIAQKLGNRLGEATALSNIGSGLERLGDPAGAAAAWETALAIYEALGSPSADSMRRWLERVRKSPAPVPVN